LRFEDALGVLFRDFDVVYFRVLALLFSDNSLEDQVGILILNGIQLILVRPHLSLRHHLVAFFKLKQDVYDLIQLVFKIYVASEWWRTALVLLASEVFLDLIVGIRYQKLFECPGYFAVFSLFRGAYLIYHVSHKEFNGSLAHFGLFGATIIGSTPFVF